MESGIKNSFIPRDTAESGGHERAPKGNFLDLLMIISIVLFVGSIALGAGVFLYQQYLEASGKSKLATIEKAKAAFAPELILDLTRLDDRMRNGDAILAKHIAPSILFRMLEQVTLTTVSFRSLNFESSNPQNISVKMNGIAQSVNSIALQADLFSKNGIIINPIFSNIDREKDGVHFSLTASVNPSPLRYAQLVAAAGLPPSQAPQSVFTPQASPFEPQTRPATNTRGQ